VVRVPPVQKHCFRIPQILSVGLVQDNTCYLFIVTEAFIRYDNLQKSVKVNWQITPIKLLDREMQN